MWRNNFCKYHFGTGCLKGEQCPFSHSPTIPRNPHPCNGCDDRSLCPYLHSDEKWTRWMPPIVHPQHVQQEAEDLRKDLIATHEELGWVYKQMWEARAEAKRLQQELDMRTYETLDGEIHDTRWKADMESVTAVAVERGVINQDLRRQLEAMEVANQDLINQDQDLRIRLEKAEVANRELCSLAQKNGQMLVEQRDAVLKALGLGNIFAW
jgi:hypothetical protein